MLMPLHLVEFVRDHLARNRRAGNPGEHLPPKSLAIGLSHQGWIGCESMDPRVPGQFDPSRHFSVVHEKFDP